MSLALAIDDLKAELIDGVPVDDAIALISHEYGLKAVFLENRAIAALGDLSTVGERHRASVEVNKEQLEAANKKIALSKLKAKIHDHNTGVKRVSDDELYMLVEAANELGADYRVSYRRPRRPNYDRALRDLIRSLM